MAEKNKEDNVEDLSSYGIHFCLISRESAPNFLPIICYRPKKVLMFVSESMHEKAQAIRDAVNNAAPEVKFLDDVPVGDGWDGNICYQCVSKALYEHLDEDPIVNITGGTKIMAFAALMAVRDIGLSAFYMKTDRRRPSEPSEIMIFPGGDMSKKKVSHLSRYRLKIDDYLSAYGYTVTPRKSDNSQLPRERRRLAEYLLQADGFGKLAVVAMNGMAQEAEDRYDRLKKHVDRKGKVPEVLTDLAEKRRSIQDGAVLAAFDKLCKLCEEIGLLGIYGNTVRFPSLEHCNYVKGGWLEEYVYDTLDTMGLKPVMNLKIKKDGEREIDVAFMHKEKLYVLECKSSNLTRKTKQNHSIIYQIKTLKDLGGIETVLVLVSYQNVNIEIKTSAGEIKIFQGGQVNDLKDHIRELISSSNTNAA